MKKASPHIKEKTVPKLGGAYHILQHYLLSGFMADGGIRCKTLILYAFDKDGRLEKCYPPPPSMVPSNLHETTFDHG